MTGYIYKITFPNGAIYVGQTSKSLTSRLNNYRRLECKTQKKLFYCLKKYGIGSATVITLEQPPLEDLDAREIYWIDTLKTNYYKHPLLNGLNLCDGGKGSKGKLITPLEKERLTRQINSYPKRKKGEYKPTEETIKKLKISLKKAKEQGRCNKPGYLLSEETKKKISNAMKNRFNKHSLGRKQTEDEKKKQIENQKKLILHTHTGIFYHGIEEAAFAINSNKIMVGLLLTGNYKGRKDRKIPLIYV